MQELNNVINNLPPALNRCISGLPEQLKNRVVELRLRVNKPLLILTPSQRLYVDYCGNRLLTEKGAVIITPQLLQETMLCITGRAIHSKQYELAKGYVTMSGGNRVGIAGTAIIEDGMITGVKNITSLNIRIAKNALLPDISAIKHILLKDMFSLLIIGVPRSGKTTLLKSVSEFITANDRQLTIVDTRCEIAPNVANYFSCDVLSGFPRAEGITSAIKSLAPDVIICDEIGDDADARAIDAALHSGVNLVVTAHADSIVQLDKRPALARLVKMGAFTDIALLEGANNPGVIKEVARWAQLMS